MGFFYDSASKITGIVLVAAALFMTLATGLLVRLFKISEAKRPRAMLIIKLAALGVLLLSFLFLFGVIVF